MFTENKILFLQAKSPVHAGSGNDLGYIDLPIQREKHTGYPKVEASSLKGAMRERLESVGEKVDKIMGSKNSGDHAAALALSDVRLLFFPVKSLKGTFAWVTCPAVLEGFKDAFELCGGTSTNIAFPRFEDEEKVYCGDDCELFVKNTNLVLEDYSYTAEKQKEVTAFAQKLGTILSIKNLAQKLLIVPDDEFKDIVELHTEVITRNKISEKGTAENLFNEEFLPAESILYSMCFARKDFKDRESLAADIMNRFEKFFSGNNAPLKYFQIGGDASLGKGIVKATIYSAQ